MIQFRIDTILCQQLLMRAFLLDPVRRQHKNALGIPDRGKAVGDDKGRPAFRQLLHRLLHDLLALIVERGSRLVKNQDRRIFQKYPCD